ncbi:MAG: hypothetical protein FJX02_15360 [Alphaproteobacteria bacterium]|nr:hypothetical protein [Alphaproteobacteria bacterium]
MPERAGTVDPYVSVAFVNRNDGYGGDLELRMARFIEYYAPYTRRWPGLFEFVVCDWNPPPDKKPLRDAFDWGALGDVLHVTVPPELHRQLAGPRGRPMLDYFGRNAAIRRSRGVFSLVMNQDIYAGQSVMEVISRRALSERHFYRADRRDFDFEPCREEAGERIEAAARANVFAVHRRHSTSGHAISNPVDPSAAGDAASILESGDVVEPATGIIDCVSAERRRRTDRLYDLAWRVGWRSAAHRAWRDEWSARTYYTRFNLHTNAAGDFLLAPRAAFEKIQGMPESTEIYMHTDSYAVMQLFAAGYRQAVFDHRHAVYHADHDRSARAGFNEGMEYAEHEAVFSDIVRGTRSYVMNGPDWGLGNIELPTQRLGA